MPTAVEVQDLTKIYYPSPRWMKVLLRSAISEPVLALDRVSLTVKAGESCAIVGVNGAGKSTLFRVITGLTTPTSGSIRVCGFDVERAPKSVRAQVGFVPAGDQTLYLRLSCRDNLIFHGQLAGLAGHLLRRRIKQVLELVSLSDVADRVGFALSAGMRARLQLARALMHRPRVLILDEPTASVDPVGAYELLQDIEEVASNDGVAVLISSHRLEEIEALRNRVLLMDAGRILYDGPLDDLPRPEERTITFRFIGAVDSARARLHLSRLSDVDLVDDVALPPNELTARSDLPVGQLIARLDGVLDGLTGVEESRQPLREVIYGILRHAGGPAKGPFR
ncbi:MAG: ABC transporter ATP-binding protein [Acidimicrobiales bacterium]